MLNPLAYGALCRVAFYSNLALGALNNSVTIELSTPYSVDPTGEPTKNTSLKVRPLTAAFAPQNN